MSTPRCASTGLDLPVFGNWRQNAVEYRHTLMEANQDGSGHVWTLSAALFCSDDCLADWLQRFPGSESAHKRRPRPCTLDAGTAEDETGNKIPREEPF